MRWEQFLLCTCGSALTRGSLLLLQDAPASLPAALAAAAAQLQDAEVAYQR